MRTTKRPAQATVLTIFTIAGITAASTARATTCPTSNVINDPPQFQWVYHATNGATEAHYSATMEVGEHTFMIGGETLTTRAYRQAGTEYTIPGPTITMVPGNKYVLRFRNTLPYEAAVEDHNILKDPNVSNIHTHGLHISGETPSDDVTRSFEGGTGGDFVYDIPADHMGGTYWYHAHHHGSTMLQVSGGMFGQLIIDDSNDGIPANVAAMTERQLVIAYLDPGAAGSGGDTLLGGTLSETWTVNGNVTGNLCMPSNEWQHWRVLLADRNASPKTITVGLGCEVQLLARDGVWRTKAPKALATNSVTITGASRADLAVRCTGDADLRVGNVQVADIYVDGAITANLSPHPFATDDDMSQWSARRPNYLKDLSGASGVNTESVRMGARTVNGSKFDLNVPTFSLVADQVQEWGINGAGKHPFHLHVYHMQTFGCGGDYEDGEWYDVVAGNCDVRFDLNAGTTSAYEGRTIMHCHILEHEDQGAMGWLEVIGGLAAPTFPEGADYSASYDLGVSPPADPPAAPSGLTASAVSSSAIDLSWVDNSDNEEGFNLYRFDGSTFTLLASTAADVTNYSDDGLSADTTYQYQVAAFNTAGESAVSNEANATTSTDTGTTPISMSVGSNVVDTQGAGRGQREGTARVIIVDNNGDPVPSATVSGWFNINGIDELPVSEETQSDGGVSLVSSSTASGNVSVTFCVTGVSHASLPDITGEVCASN